MSEDIRVLIADDDPIIHDSFARLLDSQDGIKVEATASNGAEALTKMTRSIDVALIDVDMPILDGIEAAKLIRKSYPQTTIIMLTAFEHEDSLAQALAAGVQGFLTKNTTPKEIAQELHMSPTTVRSYVSEILAHTGCKSRRQLAITAAHAGITQ